MKKKKGHKEKQAIDYYDNIQRFAQAEVERGHKTFKTYIWTISIILSVGAFLIGASVFDIQRKYKSEMNLRISVVKKDIVKRLDSIEYELNKRIAEEFQKENINILVERQAKIRVDKIAEVIIRKQVKEKIIPIENSLARLEAETNKRIERVIFDYYILQMKNNSRSAFTKVFNYSKDKSFVYHKEARLEIAENIADLNKLSRSTVIGSIEYGIDYNKASFIDVKDMYLNGYIHDDKISFIFDLMKSGRGKGFKIDFLYFAIEEEKSLDISYLLGNFLVKKLDLTLMPYDFEGIIDAKK